MKLLVTGATGLVGTEVIRQALGVSSITSVVALARREVKVPEQVAPDADTSKLKTVIVEDWEKYTPEVKEAIKGADACLWLLAITPAKSKAYVFDQVRKVCLDYTVAGIREMSTVANKPFRFIYTAGAMTERDQTKKLALLGEYRLMRGEVENQVLAFASQSSGAVEAQVTRPGAIDGPGRGMIVSAIAVASAALGVMPKVHVSEIAAAMLQQAEKGLEKETLENADLVRLAKEVLGDGNEKYVK
ncbi:putative nucleoside-diphosphate-sugar epimerase [Mytilinidion resinicola]|uniref:Nucleoside-diphosphate-sugar epimerase n=1 Tax=Mytilinidion resinicola TaxID=574789 RepID=A0A6A6XZW3_9PEZI|nr:putative nucleoside-diphosphate-sugar epimerase [Mytilinidion resinicola]KAF2801803.1 putative nucleoside-diphosphate-sugar epimerase [Mytilinidion resinicola]